MAKPKRMPAKANTSAPKKKRKEKNKTQPKPPMQRIAIIGPTGKRRLEWRPW